jgi:56kDa selenium binding protein (SBP56)
MVENGVNPELLLAGKYGHQLHVWDLSKRRHRQVLDLGAEYQMALELRPAHDPKKAYGLCRRRRLTEGPVVVDLAVAPQRRRRK